MDSLVESGLRTAKKKGEREMREDASVVKFPPHSPASTGMGERKGTLNILNMDFFKNVLPQLTSGCETLREISV